MVPPGQPRLSRVPTVTASASASSALAAPDRATPAMDTPNARDPALPSLARLVRRVSSLKLADATETSTVNVCAKRRSAPCGARSELFHFSACISFAEADGVQRRVELLQSSCETLRSHGLRRWLVGGVSQVLSAAASHNSHRGVRTPLLTRCSNLMHASRLTRKIVAKRSVNHWGNKA